MATETEANLNKIKEHSRMSLVALSTSTLLEQPQNEDIKKLHIDRMIKFSPYKVIQMKNIIIFDKSCALDLKKGAPKQF